MRLPNTNPENNKPYQLGRDPPVSHDSGLGQSKGDPSYLLRKKVRVYAREAKVGIARTPSKGLICITTFNLNLKSVGKITSCLEDCEHASASQSN